MKKILIALSLMLALFFYYAEQAYCEPHQEKVQVEAEGSGPTKLDALKQAWMEAVRNAVGMFMTSTTELNNDDITEKIVTYRQGQVDSFKILEESQKNGIYYTKIIANIDKDILQSAAEKSSQKQVIAFDGSNIAAREQSKSYKDLTKSDSLRNIISQVDYIPMIGYYAYPKIFKNKNGEEKIYLIHILYIDYDKYMKIANNLKSVMSRLAIDTGSVSFNNPENNKIIYNTTKNIKNIADIINYKRFNLNRLNNVSINDLNKKSTSPSQYCINPSTGGSELNDGCYGITDRLTATTVYELYDSKKTDRNIQGAIYKELCNLEHTFRVTFIAESGSGFDSEIARNSDLFIIGSNYILNPVFRYKGNSSILVFIQDLNLSKEQLVSLKELTGRYELELVRKGRK